MRNVPVVIITHHTGGTDAAPLADSSFATVNDINAWHKARWPDFVSRSGWHVGYHYVIEKSGKVVQTRNHDEEGAHCLGMNRKSIGVCFAGNFDLTLPTPEQIQAWNNLYGELLQQYPNIPTFPHRKYATKTCHGKRLSDDFFTRERQLANLKIRLDQLKSMLASAITRRRMR